MTSEGIEEVGGGTEMWNRCRTTFKPGECNMQMATKKAEVAGVERGKDEE